MNNHWRQQQSPRHPRGAFENLGLWISAGAIALILVAILFGCTTDVFASEATTKCPNPGETCKVLLITSQEEQLLIRQGGILDTAQAGRYIDLGSVVAYFRARLMNAPAGEVTEVPKPAQSPAPAAN